ncbi:MAG: type I restriction endonuclease subunit R, partial [Candidatus Pacearchaeota archaeon]|nr:type I restriction endonuclease subunit R [Candidatus Pacearchaeota archaeon]
MASIMTAEVTAWEKLFWFLKFLIPKLKVRDPDADQIDELLESVDLTSYGLERVKLNNSIGLDDSETELDPQSPNVRGAHGGDEETDPLDEIIKSFNERWFQGWSATPEEQRIKFINIAESIKAHPDFKDKYQNNQDVHNRELAFQKIFEDVMLKNRRNELELYKLLANDEAFKAAMQQSLKRVVSESP